jgi:adenylate kinase
VKILMLAPPGGGKGTQGTRIAEELGLDHVSSGDLLREAVAQDTPLGREVAGYMDKGELAPDALVADAIKPVLEHRDSYVLDGFPRNRGQAEGLAFDAVIYLDVPEEVLTRRLLGRGRKDDRPEVIERRLREYAQDTEPLIGLYREQGVLIALDGDRPPDEITAELLEKLRPQPRA